MSGKPHVNIKKNYAKLLLDVVTLSKALCPTIANGNYECSFTHYKQLRLGRIYSSIKLLVSNKFILFVLLFNYAYISGQYVCVYKDLNDALLS